MKKTLPYIALTVFLYLSFAFAIWDFNPTNWGFNGRLMFAIFTMVSGFLIWSHDVLNEQ
jgi:hypothetical protein